MQDAENRRNAAPPLEPLVLDVIGEFCVLFGGFQQAEPNDRHETMYRLEKVARVVASVVTSYNGANHVKILSPAVLNGAVAIRERTVNPREPAGRETVQSMHHACDAASVLVEARH